jgi:hypothetical protein
VYHHNAAGAHEAGETVQGGGRIRKVLEDEPADQRVEPLAVPKSASSGLMSAWFSWRRVIAGMGFLPLAAS